MGMAPGNAPPPFLIQEDAPSAPDDAFPPLPVIQEVARQRSDIKERVQVATRALGHVMAIVPGGEPVREEVDRMLARLEAMTPTDKPLNMRVGIRDSV